MDFKEYQDFITEFQNSYETEDTDKRLACLTLGLATEASEVADRIYKHLRDNATLDRVKTEKELGDTLAMLTALASFLGMDLETIAKINRAKLEDRQLRNVVKGSGDDR